MFVPFIFLTITGLSSFYSLDPCFTAIFLSINISVVLVSKSTFTVIPSYMSTFSTPMFSYTSLNILNILLIFLCLFSFFAILFRVPVHIPLYCTFLSMGCTATLQFHYGFFFHILYSGHKIFLLSCSNTLLSIVFFLSYSTHCTLVISPLLS